MHDAVRRNRAMVREASWEWAGALMAPLVPTLAVSIPPPLSSILDGKIMPL